MIWSISKYREFNKCSRKWFYDQKFAANSDGDPLRKEAYHLSQLSSIDGWKGNIVDYSISNFVIPKISQKRTVNKYQTIEETRRLTRARYNFAQQKKYRQDGLKKTEHEYDYAALYEFEYETGIDLNAKFKVVWEEIESAIENFLSNQELLTYLGTAEYLVTQRALTYRKHDATVKGVPDLIAFFKESPPHIFDWKAHHFGTKKYNQQLVVYSIALELAEPHIDFPRSYRKYRSSDFKISEFQLLTNSLRDYKVEDDFVQDTEQFIADGIYTMLRMGCDLEFKKLKLSNFRETYNPDHCTKCPFKKICWSD